MSENQSKRGKFWRGIVSHKPLKKHIEWWLRGLAIIAVPAIIACTIAISVELAAESFGSTFFKSGAGAIIAQIAEGLLNTAIEGSMLGCIAIAKQARREGEDQQANTMTVVGWGFAVLTVVTIGFHVFKANQQASQYLLLFRCGAGIAYCYLAHLGQDDESEIEGRVTRVQQQNIEQLFAQFGEKFTEIEGRFSTFGTEAETRLSTLKAETERAFQSVEGNLQFQFQSFSEGLRAEIEGVKTETTESQGAEMRIRQYLDQRLSAMTETTEMALKSVETSLTEMRIKAEQKPAQQVSPAPAKERQPRPIASVKIEGMSDRESFVFQCLEEDSEMSLAEIQRRATERGLSISTGSASTYRKNFNEKLKLKGRLKIVGD